MRHTNGGNLTFGSLAAFCLTVALSFSPCQAGEIDKTTVTFTGSLRNIFAEPAPMSLRDDKENWRQWLDRNLLPTGRAGLFTSAPVGGRDLSGWRPDDDRPQPVEVRDALRDRAREESYRIGSELLFAWGPINRIRKVIEPYSRPLQLYRGDDGGVSAGMFGQQVADGGSRVLNLRLELSPRHNLNLWADLFGGMTVGYLEGRILQFSYAPPSEDYSVAIYQEGADRTLLAASLSF